MDRLDAEVRDRVMRFVLGGSARDFFGWYADRLLQPQRWWSRWTMDARGEIALAHAHITDGWLSRDEARHELGRFLATLRLNSPPLDDPRPRMSSPSTTLYIGHGHAPTPAE